MSVQQVRMPQLGETVDEGTVVAWLKKPGEDVAEREPLLEVSTDKVDTEIESMVAGVVQSILVEEGETVAVGTVLAEIAVAGGGEPDADADAEPGQEVTGHEATAATPDPAAAPPAAVDREHLLLSPRVRRLIEEHHIDLDELAAFATSPRIDRKTVERYLEQRQPTAETRAEAAPDVDGPRTIPFTRLRRRIAERMVESKTTSAHVVTAIEVDFESVAELRQRHRDLLRAEHDLNLTYLPFVACATARTLREFERLNASVSDQSLVVHSGVHLGVAVDLAGEGLIVPVVRDAHSLGLLEMARAIQEAAERARAGELHPDDLAGGTFTLSAQGPHGTLFTAPIINQPQVAILSVDGIAKRPAVVTDVAGRDALAIRHTGVLAMSWDHRAVDGAYAAAFLAALRDCIMESSWAEELEAFEA